MALAKSPKLVNRTIHVALFGCGGANTKLSELLAEKHEDILRGGVNLCISAVFTGTRGCARIRKSGCRALAVPNAVLDGSAAHADNDLVEVCKECNTWAEQLRVLLSLHADGLLDVVCEAVPADYTKGEPALSLAREMLRLGVHVATANKAPVALALDELETLAATTPTCRFLFETVVMDGVPVFNMARKCMLGARILGFEGILNSTTNVILSAMEDNPELPFEAGLARAQEMGIVEADPAGDIDGFDAAVKCVCLCRALLGVKLSLDNVQPRDSIRHVQQTDIARARADNKSRLMLVCEGKVTGDAHGVSCAVRLRSVPPTSSLYNLRGSSACVTLFTDVMGPVTIVSTDPSLRDTGYGLFSDLLDAINWRASTPAV